MFIPFQLFCIIQAFIPFERTTGYYDLGECLTIGIFLALLLEFLKRLCYKFLSPIFAAFLFASFCSCYDAENDRQRITLEKVEKLKHKKKV